jgi:hypothetical protein
VTNDGATILKNIGVDNPAAKVLVGTESRDSFFLALEESLIYLFLIQISLKFKTVKWEMVRPR